MEETAVEMEEAMEEVEVTNFSDSIQSIILNKRKPIHSKKFPTQFAVDISFIDRQIEINNYFLSNASRFNPLFITHLENQNRDLQMLKTQGL